FLFFFFQAEDGIRDFHVTGVQTCALPILILVWLIASRGLRAGLVTANPLGHFWRGLMGTAAMGFGFAGLGLLPLPEVTAIGYAADRKSTRLNSSHVKISYAVFCLKKKEIF